MGWCSAPIYNHGGHCCWCGGEIDWANAYVESARQFVLRRAEELKAEMRRIVDFHRVDVLRPAQFQQWKNPLGA